MVEISKLALIQILGINTNKIPNYKEVLLIIPSIRPKYM